MLLCLITFKGSLTVIMGTIETMQNRAYVLYRSRFNDKDHVSVKTKKRRRTPSFDKNLSY